MWIAYLNVNLKASLIDNENIINREVPMWICKSVGIIG